MPTTHPRIKITVTPEELEALKQEVARRGITQSQLMRYALAAMIPNWPNNLPTHGGKRETKSEESK